LHFTLLELALELSISVPVLSESFSLVGQNEVMFESDVSSVLPGFCFWFVPETL
jgi:hypothetical protein